MVHIFTKTIHPYKTIIILLISYAYSYCFHISFPYLVPHSLNSIPSLFPCTTKLCCLMWELNLRAPNNKSLALLFSLIHVNDGGLATCSTSSKLDIRIYLRQVMLDCNYWWLLKIWSRHKITPCLESQHLIQIKRSFQRRKAPMLNSKCLILFSISFIFFIELIWCMCNYSKRWSLT